MVSLRAFFAVATLLLTAGLTAQVNKPSAPSAAEIAAAARPSADATWWKHAVLYEIYPRSFQDSNGDGVGDLNGITQRMGYLEGLGVDAIWIAPMYPSPQVDFGYDISNYETVDPQYGTLADFDKLVRAGKQHHVRIVLDMVLNHTSDKHPWFVESASSRNNPRADWYVWSNGKPANDPSVTAYERRYEHDGMVPPNNWVSLFGGSAWEWNAKRKQFYYHKFYKQQPDLNWNNPAVEKAMFDAMRFWLDRGVAGFRLDAIPTLFEDPQMRDEPVAKAGVNAQGDPYLKNIYTDGLPKVHDVLRRMRSMVEKYPGDRVLIGETYTANISVLDQWYGAKKDELQLPMDMLLGFHNSKLNAAFFRHNITAAETQLQGSQPLFVFDNHDRERSWDRYGDGVHNLQIAKIVATVLYTTRAAALTYYGADIGMTTTTPTRKEDVKDPIGITGWPKEKGRDGERTPMQWTAGPQAGFSTDPHTWLPIPASYKTVNVQTESGEPGSLLNWTKELIALRRSNAALHNGGIVMLNEDSKDVLAYIRTAPKGSAPVVVAMNMSAQPQTVSLDLTQAGAPGHTLHTLMTSDPALQKVTSPASVTLSPFSSWVAAIQ